MKKDSKNIKLYLIRHGKTYGNTLGRYIGTTDESLCAQGLEELKSLHYPRVDLVYVSPLKRCLETASILYPDTESKVIPELRECDFGSFENKNYQELNENPEYQKWIDSNGSLPFPEGEDQKQFRSRCCEGFAKAIQDAIEKDLDKIAFVVHGGTIMSLLDKYSCPHRDFYEWQVKNAMSIEAELNIALWKNNIREVKVHRN